MPDESRLPKLTPEAREALMGWLCEGYRNSEVLGQLQSDFGIEITRQAVDGYRDRYADEIDAAREEALKRAAQQGFSNRIRRIDRLQRLAEKLGKAAEGTPKDALSVSAEIRALLRDIRDEYGDLKTRQELTGKDGGKIGVEVEQTGDGGDPTEQTARVLGILLDSGALQPGTGGAAPAEVDDVDSDKAD